MVADPKEEEKMKRREEESTKECYKRKTESIGGKNRSLYLTHSFENVGPHSLEFDIY